MLELKFRNRVSDDPMKDASSRCGRVSPIIKLENNLAAECLGPQETSTATKVP
jgi:hypothetical protein